MCLSAYFGVTRTALFSSNSTSPVSINASAIFEAVLAKVSLSFSKRLIVIGSVPANAAKSLVESFNPARAILHWIDVRLPIKNIIYCCVNKIYALSSIVVILLHELIYMTNTTAIGFERLNKISDSATQVEAIARALEHVPSVSEPSLADLADALAIQSEALRGLVDTLAIEHGDSAERSLPIFLEQLQLTREAALALNNPVKGIAYTLTTLTISLLDNIKNDLDLQQLELD